MYRLPYKSWLSIMTSEAGLERVWSQRTVTKPGVVLCGRRMSFCALRTTQPRNWSFFTKNIGMKIFFMYPSLKLEAFENSKAYGDGRRVRRAWYYCSLSSLGKLVNNYKLKKAMVYAPSANPSGKGTVRWRYRERRRGSWPCYRGGRLWASIQPDKTIENFIRCDILVMIKTATIPSRRNQLHQLQL